ETRLETALQQARGRGWRYRSAFPLQTRNPPVRSVAIALPPRFTAIGQRPRPGRPAGTPHPVDRARCSAGGTEEEPPNGFLTPAARAAASAVYPDPTSSIQH